MKGQTSFIYFKAVILVIVFQFRFVFVMLLDSIPDPTGNANLLSGIPSAGPCSVTDFNGNPGFNQLQTTNNLESHHHQHDMSNDVKPVKFEESCEANNDVDLMAIVDSQVGFPPRFVHVEFLKKKFQSGSDDRNLRLNPLGRQITPRFVADPSVTC